MKYLSLILMFIFFGCNQHQGSSIDINFLSSQSNASLKNNVLIYDSNGAIAGNPPNLSLASEGVSIVVEGNVGSLAKTNFAFVGWNTKADGSGSTYPPGQLYTMGATNITLYAKWVFTPSYTLTYNDNSATAGTVPATSNGISGASIIVSSNTGSLTKTNYTFSGWNTLANGTGTTYTAGQTFTMGPSNTILYALWIPTYTLSYNDNASTGGSVPSTASGVSGASLTISSNTGSLVKTNYIFSGWNTLANGTGTTYTAGQTFTLGSSNTTLYALWTPTYTLSYNDNSSTSGAIPSSYTGTTGETLTISSNTGSLVRTNYLFMGWNTLANGTGTTYTAGQTFTMGSSNTTLYALWTPIYTLSYNDNSSTAGTVPSSYTGTTGTSTTVSGNTGTLTKTNFTFSGWNTMANGAGTTYTAGQTFTMGSSSTTLYALWTPTGLLASYSFNTGTGSTVPDASSNGNDLTIMNLTDITWTATAHTGTAIDLACTRVNNDFIQATNTSTAFFNLTSFTLMGWVRLNSLQAWAFPPLLGYISSSMGPGYDGYGIYPDVGNTWYAGVKGVVCYVNDENVAANVILTVGVWAHVACTFDGSVLSVYVDGVLKNSFTTTRALTLSKPVSEYQLYVGGFDDLNALSFDGKVDDIRILNRSLNASEINTLKNSAVLP